MELKHLSLIFLLGAHFSVWVGSNAEIDIQDNFNYLKQKLTEMEGRMSLLEERETADLIQAVEDKLLAAVQESEINSLEVKRQLSAKIEEVENESRNKRDDLSVKLQELRQWTMDQRDDVLQRVTEVEMRCAESTMDVQGKLQNAESRFTKVDNSLLLEVLQLKTMSHEADKRMNIVEQEFTSAFESERLKYDALEAKMNEITSQIPSADDIRRSMSTLTEDLRLKIDESLISRFENIQSNLTKVRVIENSTSKCEKDCANVSYVSMLHENLKNLEINTKQEMATLQTELSPRIELLEEKSALCNDVPEMKKTLETQSSQLNRLSQTQLEFEKFCYDEPPPLLNGRPLNFDRNSGSIVRYECDKNFVMTGNSTVNCTSGKWVGRPPVCKFFDASFTVVTYVWHNITCYSDENYQRMQFSRIHNSGWDEDLTGVETTVGQKAASLNIYTLPFDKKYGLYKCGFKENNKSALALVPFQYQYEHLYFMHSSKIANIGDTVDLEVITTRDASKLRWRHDGEPVPSWDGVVKVTISNVKPEDAGVYECNHDGTRALMKLVVRKCGKDLYGDNCDKNCPPCYNGGICHDILGICVCPPGFTGNSCEVACDEDRFGADCSQTCLKSDCKFHIFCKSDPYGCSCAPGFTRYTCFKGCDSGWYGADCRQPCHCANGPESCNRYTGACRGGCSTGWTGQSCQIRVVK